MNTSSVRSIGYIKISMRGFISILLLLSDVSWVCCVHIMKGSVGGYVHISCEYPQEYDPTSVCLMKMSNRETVIETTNKNGTEYTKGRYSLYHDSNVKIIMVTIHSLNTEDAGTYRCVPAVYTDNKEDYMYTEFRLEVKQVPPSSVLPPPLAPPTSKPPLTTGSTSAHQSPTGDTHSSRNTRAPESTSVQGNSNTTQSQAGQKASLYGGLAAAVLVGLVVLTIILMRTRAKRTETPQSSQRNPSNAEEFFSGVQ
ncbi:uncharacterized protein LOC143138388 isoform X2 [Alosa pseudoharengus]|uniref:uncharacterized protein LOC143138388 isoform X2 n=1 Tax=Alosa pseudoharengus TaxID=34774 RepID=UPI003F8CB323